MKAILIGFEVAYPPIMLKSVLFIFIILASFGAYAEFQTFASPPKCNDVLKMTILGPRKGVLTPKPLIAKIAEKFWHDLIADLKLKGESESTIVWLLDPIVTMAKYQDSVEFEKPLKRYYPEKAEDRQFHDAKWSVLSDNKKGFVHDALYVMSFTPTGRALIKKTIVWAFYNRKVREKFLSLDIKDYPTDWNGQYDHSFKGYTNGCALMKISKRLELGLAIMVFAHEMSHAEDYLNSVILEYEVPVQYLLTEHRAYRQQQQIMRELLDTFPDLQQYKQNPRWQFVYEMTLTTFAEHMVNVYKHRQKDVDQYLLNHPAWKNIPQLNRATQ